MLDFDTMLMHVGEFGLYQKVLFIFQAPFCIFVTFVVFGQLFMTLSPMNYWCEEHFACLTPKSQISSAIRRNITFQWRDGGLFQNDPCDLNDIDDKFLSDLNVWDKSECAKNRSRECAYYDNRTGSRGVGSWDKWQSSTVGPPAQFTLEDNSEGGRVRRKRHYGSYGRAQHKIPTPATGRSTEYDNEDTTEYDGEAWGSQTGSERQYGSGSRYGGSSSSSSYDRDRDSESGSYGGDRGSQGGSRDRDRDSQSGSYGGDRVSQGGSYGGDRGSQGGSYGGDRGSQGGSYGGDRGSQGGSYGGDRGSQGGSYGGDRRPQNGYDRPQGGSSSSRPGGQKPGSGKPDNESPATPGKWGSSASSQTGGSKSRQNCGILSKKRLKELGPRTDQKTHPAYAGWPMPECPKPRQRQDIFLGVNARIVAEAMNQRISTTKSCRRIEACSKIRWNNSDLPYETVATEGMWWCDVELYTTIAQAVFFLGAIVGGFLIGWIADTFGRVPALVIANVLGALGGALSAVSTNIWAFSAFRFITGMAFDNCFTMMYILVLEFCGPSYRTLVANLSIAIFYTLGTIALPIIAWLIGDWKIYALVISLPMLLALLALFFVPESARWLLSKGRAAEATKILRSFAKVNRRKVDDQVFVNFEQEATKLYAQLEQEEQEPGLTAAFRTPRLRRTFILLIIFWSLIALVYDGHSRNIINLANEDLNVFWMFGIASSTEFPADMMLIFTLDRFGRRWLAFGSMTLSGAFSIIAAVITPDQRTPFLIAAMFSRFWVNVAFNIGLQYAAELLPTVIRAQGVNAIHIMGYVASIISPFVAAIGRSSPALSLILLGGFSVAAGFTALFLSETLGEELPNTLEEAEQFEKNQSFFNCPICAKEKDEEPMVPPAALDERPVILRNALRGSIRGETYRSSMISNSSSGGANRRSQMFNPGGPSVSRAPEPTELTKLRRTTH